MSFDVHFQGFRHGDSTTTGGAAMRRIMQLHITHEEPKYGFLTVEIGDGGADVYLRDSGMMANHLTGTDVVDLLVRGAQAAEWVIMPVGCPTCVTSREQISHLPRELVDDVVLVGSGSDLLAVLRS